MTFQGNKYIREMQHRHAGISTTMILFLLLAGMLVVFSLVNSDFRSIYNIRTLLINISFTGLVAGFLTLIMITGGIDLSVGGTIALVSCVMGLLHNQPDPMPVSSIIFIALLLGAAIGSFNGLLITKLKLDPIITTIGTMTITHGAAYVLTHGRSVLMLDDTISFIGMGNIFGVPVPIYLLLLSYTGLGLLLSISKFGRKIYCIGANEEAARVSGIRVNRTKFILYLLTGISAAVSGIMLVGQSGVGMPQHAKGSELEIITAILLGGTSLYGGKGSIPGTLAGVLILGVLFNGFTMVGFQYVYIKIFQGLLLILIVTVYQLKEKKRYGSLS